MKQILWVSEKQWPHAGSKVPVVLSLQARLDPYFSLTWRSEEGTHVVTEGTWEWWRLTLLLWPEQVMAQCPERFLALSKWAGMSLAGPAHYLENTLFQAGEQDCYGLLKDERRPMTDARGQALYGLYALVGGPDQPLLHPSWKESLEYPDAVPLRLLEPLLAVLPGDGPLETQNGRRFGEPPQDVAVVKPVVIPTLEWRPRLRIGEGKARDLKAARESAFWPDATDEDLTAPGLEQRLQDRLPGLIDAFKADLDAANFDWRTAC